jgi:Family of unknown function (DUF6328)
MSDEESRSERLDRELMELLQELRVVLPGVQVLLAFLLTAPFQQRFAQLPGSLRNAYFASIACATVAVVLWRAGEKERLLRIGNQMALWGTVFLAAAIVLALYVVTNVLFTSELAIATAAAAAVVFAGIWYALPLLGRPAQDESEAGAASPDGQPHVSRGASSRR